jgi:hypothetical protein
MQRNTFLLQKEFQVVLSLRITEDKISSNPQGKNNVKRPVGIFGKQGKVQRLTVLRKTLRQTYRSAITDTKVSVRDRTDRCWGLRALATADS